MNELTNHSSRSRPSSWDFVWHFAAAQRNNKALQHARELLRTSLLIDGHNDVAWLIREETEGDIEAFGLADGHAPGTG